MSERWGVRSSGSPRGTAGRGTSAMIHGSRPLWTMLRDERGRVGGGGGGSDDLVGARSAFAGRAFGFRASGSELGGWARPWCIGLGLGIGYDGLLATDD